jgi:DNA-binding MarR family transcriptional regulator/GNAT superfamily N-acetyltransferase
MDAGMTDEVALVRRFNRSYTRRIGVLGDSYLDTGRRPPARPLGPSRVLFELGAGPTRVGELRRRLGLDSGYLSRLLRQLELEELVRCGRDPSDGRQRIVRLTAHGRRAWQRLDRRSELLAAQLVEPLAPRQRAALAAALATADRLLCAAAVTFDAIDPGAEDAQAAMRRYFAELDLRFANGFDPGEGGADGDAVTMAAPDGAFVLVRSDDEVIGCGGVLCLDTTTAEIKRMWIDPDWRGVGLAGRLLSHLESRARVLGRERVVLDTNESLSEAIAMYHRFGYVPIGRYNDNPYAHHWFEKHLAPVGRSSD